MPYFDQQPSDVRCEWGLGGLQHLSAVEVVIIVDVLSFSTTVDIALHAGAIVFPYQWRDDSAERYAQKVSAQLAGPRDARSQGYSLSPSSLINAPQGLRLVLPSPNGSALSSAAMASGAHVIAGSLRNASAVSRAAQLLGKRIAVVPAGEHWPDGSLRPAIEDLLGAGAITRNLYGTVSPEASLALSAFSDASKCLLERLLACSSGRELVERGFRRDVELASQLDVSDVVPILVDGAFVPWSGDRSQKHKAVTD